MGKIAFSSVASEAAVCGNTDRYRHTPEYGAEDCCVEVPDLGENSAKTVLVERPKNVWVWWIFA